MTRGRKWVYPPAGSFTSELKAAIRAELKAEGFTQKDLARHMGLSEKHVSQVLTGKVGGRLELLEAMASAVGITLGLALPADRPLAH